MVGVPRSSGCQLCRKRRVKCDEERPECGNCVKYGAECPGYERAIKFVTGKHQIRSKGSRKSRAGSAASSSDGVSVTSLSSGRSSPAASIVSSPRPNRGLLVGTLMQTVRKDIVQGEGKGAFAFFSWLQLENLGRTELLDGAVCSLALHLVGKERVDEEAIARSRTVYGQSLHALQASLKHPDRWRSSETLSSAILLCFFELFAGTTSPDTWLQHARGISILMEQRGPQAHTSGSDAAILMTFRGILIMCHMFYPTESTSFLSRPEWKAVLRDEGRNILYPSDIPDDAIRLMDDFFERLAEMPEVLWWGYPLRQAMLDGEAVSQNRVEYVARLATSSCRGFTKWFEEFDSFSPADAFVEVPSKDPRSPFETILEHKTPWVGSMLMGYWASMLIVHELMILCGVPGDFEEAQRTFVLNILRSIESVGKGVLGPYRVGYSVRIAYEFANVEIQEWLRSRLDEFSKKYAATDKQTYPSPRVDDKGYA